jgi:hypothetical protein
MDLRGKDAQANFLVVERTVCQQRNEEYQADRNSACDLPRAYGGDVS